jgi:hypothetical protein
MHSKNSDCYAYTAAAAAAVDTDRNMVEPSVADLRRTDSEIVCLPMAVEAVENRKESRCYSRRIPD